MRASGVHTGCIGRKQVLCGSAEPSAGPAANPQGGACGADDTILFAPTTVTPLFRVPASGGTAVAATTLDTPRQSYHLRPSFLPDGRGFRFYAVGDSDVSGIYLGSLEGGDPTRLTSASSGGAFLPPDRVVFLQEGRLVARLLDLTRGKLVGDPLVIQASSGVDEPLNGFSIAATGIVAYRAGRNAPRGTTWFGRSGEALQQGEGINAPNFSRDGRYLAHDRVVVDRRMSRQRVRSGRRTTRPSPSNRNETDGSRSIYCISPDGKMMAVAVAEAGASLTLAKPVEVFSAHFLPQLFTFQYAASPDKRFLVNNRVIEEASASPITLLLNWKS